MTCFHFFYYCIRRLIGLFIIEIKRDLNRRPMYEYRCDERLKGKVEGSTRLTYTGWRGGLEHLKIETRLIDERFPIVVTPRIYLSHPSITGTSLSLPNSSASTESLDVWKSTRFWENSVYSEISTLVINITQPSLTNPQITTQIPINNDMITIMSKFPISTDTNISHSYDTSILIH